MTTGITHTGLIAAIGECSSWQDIQAKWRTRPEKQKGDLFEDLVKACLQLDPEYVSKLMCVWQALIQSATFADAGHSHVHPGRR
jgi:hypothetical protein